jgi:hypothetical protein
VNWIVRPVRISPIARQGAEWNALEFLFCGCAKVSASEIARERVQLPPPQELDQKSSAET